MYTFLFLQQQFTTFDNKPLLLMFSFIKKNTINQCMDMLVQLWTNFLFIFVLNRINKAVESTGQKDILVLLIGNKLDLADEERVVETEEAEQLAGELDMKYFETSAKEGINVSEVIEYLLKSIPEKAAEVSNPENSLPITNRDTENGGQQCPCWCVVIRIPNPLLYIIKSSCDYFFVT